LPGTVEKIVKPIQGEAKKVQIAIQSGDDPKQKIRIANILVDARGEAVSLKSGAAVQIVVRPKPKDRGILTLHGQTRRLQRKLRSKTATTRARPS
jgi:hypothetical protein